MNTLGLRNDVSFCRIGTRAIFLDIQADHYFCLSPRLDDAFGALLDERHVDERDCRALVDAGVLAIEGGAPLVPCPAQAPTPSQAPGPPQTFCPTKGAGDACSHRPRPHSMHDRPASGRSAIIAAGRALISRVHWTRRVRRLTLARNIATLIARREALALPVHPPGAIDCVEQAHRAAALVWGTAGRCLPTAMAIMADLSRAGVRAHLLFGVQLEPFSAHSWVEADGRPVGDDRENVERFVRIKIA